MPAQDLEKQGAHVLKVLNMKPIVSSNNSHEELMPHTVDPAEDEGPTLKDVTRREWISIFILCFVNLINYMDRFTLAGILDDVKKEFGIGDSEGGLLQTSFVLSYMVFAPLFGYLGDRYSRRYIMTGGVLLWSLTTLVGSFMDHFPMFIMFRALVGIGEASYSTIAPTIISDLFIKNVRSKMLALFYFAIPVGSGLGYIVGAETSKAFGAWQWALRVTPGLGLLAVLLIFFVLQDPERGQSEDSGHLQAGTLKEDLKALMQNGSFILSSLGFTCVAFVAGALAWWGPTLLTLGMALQNPGSDEKHDDVPFMFGTVAMVAGVIGVPLGSFLAQRWRPMYDRIDPHLCAAGLMISAPVVFLALVTAPVSGNWCYFFVCVGMVSMNMTWSIVADILLYVVLPTRRSTAEGLQMLVSHALGDAGSPYLIGVVSDVLKIKLGNGTPDASTDFHSLQYALFITCFVEVLGGVFFLINAFYIVKDKKKVEKALKELPQDMQTPHEDPASARTSS
ncbi:PREDICTED: protein spinster isoform X3 [Nicrophorus vespilloides]|uniref:Protein spinster isoform X3 n=1 Tax=Nicrophorus vespilloides TaxID=110193 RepID=A0ABM1M9M8_NICVS|nr:PREDICTED: protein spinster isoform X3 [Nicrophorus vespilloides]